MATTDHDEAIVVADLDIEAVNNFRDSIPTFKQKRHDMYEMVDRDSVEKP
jgi:predicted amidohydrolase